MIFLHFFDQITVEFPGELEYNVAETRGDPLLNIVLVEPEIPQNCGNIARTCAATRSRLHLIRPLGFDISEKAVRRAGLDYWPMVDLRVYDGLEQFFTEHPAPDLWLATTKAPRSYDQAQFRDGCYLFFGKETAASPWAFGRSTGSGASASLCAPDARSLNLANSVAVVALRGPAPAGLSPGCPGRARWRRGCDLFISLSHA